MISFEERARVYEQAIDTYGPDAQLRMVIEEMAELTKALCKFFRGEDNLDSIAEETGDVLIMIEQLRMIFGLYDEVARSADEKVLRLAERLGIEVIVEEDPDGE